MRKYSTTIIGVLAIIVIAVVVYKMMPHRLPNHSANNIPVSECKYLGYQTPKSAIVSAAAAYRKDNGQAFVDSLSPEERKYFEFVWQRAMQKSNKTLAQLVFTRLPRVTADATIDIGKQKVLTDRWAVMTVKISAGGKHETFTVVLKKIDGEWKVDSIE